MKCKALAIAILVMTSGCSSIRMKYDAKIKLDDGKVGHYEYENSYSTGSFPALCGLTAIFLGGACWYYLVMPTTQHKNLTKQSAAEKLDELLSGKDYEVVSLKLDRTSWQDREESSNLEWNATPARLGN